MLSTNDYEKNDFVQIKYNVKLNTVITKVFSIKEFNKEVFVIYWFILTFLKLFNICGKTKINMNLLVSILNSIIQHFSMFFGLPQLFTLKILTIQLVC